MFLSKKNKRQMRRNQISEQEVMNALKYGEQRVFMNGFIKKTYVDVVVVHNAYRIDRISRIVATLSRKELYQ